MNETRAKYSEIHLDLIEKCKQNDRKAQLELYKLYSGAVYNTCLRILHNTDKAEDAMQESFIVAFDKLSAFKGESSFGAWIKRIAINKAIDELRRHNVHFENIEESAEVFKIENENNTYDEFDIQKKVQRIKKAMNYLPEGYRVVLSLHLIEGYDHEEIAQILAISESTSRSQYSRAKQKLHDLLTG